MALGRGVITLSLFMIHVLQVKLDLRTSMGQHIGREQLSPL
jgi:hypothetical protein